MVSQQFQRLEGNKITTMYSIISYNFIKIAVLQLNTEKNVTFYFLYCTVLKYLQVIVSVSDVMPRACQLPRSRGTSPLARHPVATCHVEARATQYHTWTWPPAETTSARLSTESAIHNMPRLLFMFSVSRKMLQRILFE